MFSPTLPPDVGRGVFGGVTDVIVRYHPSPVFHGESGITRDTLQEKNIIYLEMSVFWDYISQIFTQKMALMFSLYYVMLLLRNYSTSSFKFPKI